MIGRLVRLAFGLALMLAPMSGIAAAQADVLVRPSSEVTGAAITLGDMATVSCPDQALAGRLRAVPICSSPLPSKTRQLTREQIASAVRRQGIGEGSVNLICPKQVSVTRPSCLVTGQALFEAAQQYALTANQWPGTAAVEPVRLAPDETVPAGKLELRARSGIQKLRKGRNSIAVEAAVDGQVYRTLHVPILVRVIAPVLVATQAIPRSAEITGANSAMRETDITNLPEEVVTELPSGAFAALPISEGTVIRQSWITQPPAVRSGDVVVVSVIGRFVRVTDKGTAAADGRIGDKIKVRLGGEVREVRGTVVKHGLVEIQLGRRN